jgi:hypothetical protein
MEKASGEVSPGHAKTDDDDEDDWEMTLNRYRHFVPGYYRTVPPGQKPFAHRQPEESFLYWMKKETICKAG